MPQLELDRYVAHRPAEMFALVADLCHYPEFIRNCKNIRVKRDHGAHANVRYARMTLAFGPISQAYTSRVTLDEPALTINVTATDGPFRYLRSQWRFEPDGEGTHIRFSIDFKISNPLIAAVAEPAFAAKQEEIMTDFVTEADRRFAG